jgi:hypothetical protein
MYVYRVRDAREFKETILETDQGDEGFGFGAVSTSSKKKVKTNLG